jgi:hypothetical protein
VTAEVIHNGMSAADLPGAVWGKSSHSGPQGECVEVAALAPTGQIAVRNSRDPHGPALIHQQNEFAAFVTALKCGQYDHLLG